MKKMQDMSKRLKNENVLSVASRQVDAMVAEKVMGLPVKDFTRTARQPYYSWGGEYTNIHYAPNDEPYVVTGVEKAGCPEVRRINDYSTSIADAWQVVDRLKANGNNVWVEWAGTVWICGTTSVFPDVEADTAPLAICLAALKACGVEVESPK